MRNAKCGVCLRLVSPLYLLAVSFYLLDRAMQFIVMLADLNKQNLTCIVKQVNRKQTVHLAFGFRRSTFSVQNTLPMIWR